VKLEAALDRAFAPAQKAIAEGRIPGTVLAAASRDGERALRFAGAAQIEPGRDAMRADTIFDLASLTKVIFTTTEILKLVEAGVISLDDPLIVLVPDLRQYDSDAWERRVTFRNGARVRRSIPTSISSCSASRWNASTAGH